ncbi:MAG: hypothetical protein J0M08_07505 [Bacteroidetes bacterium]|nr:hypothetical protein [Bacteroidota bacterium]
MELNKNIPEDFDNLERYAPTLFSIPKTNAFLTPENYFSQLTEITIAQTSIPQLDKTELQVPDGYFQKLPDFLTTSIKLEELKNEKTFEVPAYYFDELPTRIQQLIGAQTSSFSLWNWLQQLLSPKIFAPATFVIVLLLGFYSATNLTKNETNNNTLLSADKTSIENYTDNSEIEEALLIEESDIDAISTAFADANANTDEITEYLAESTIDINTIANEL